MIVRKIDYHLFGAMVWQLELELRRLQRYGHLL